MLRVLHLLPPLPHELAKMDVDSRNHFTASSWGRGWGEGAGARVDSPPLPDPLPQINRTALYYMQACGAIDLGARGPEKNATPKLDAALAQLS